MKQEIGLSETAAAAEVQKRIDAAAADVKLVQAGAGESLAQSLEDLAHLLAAAKMDVRCRGPWALRSGPRTVYEATTRAGEEPPDL